MAEKLYGLMAKFETPGDVMRAATKVRDAGFKNWDVITPFPVHGMDEAMGLGRSRVPIFSLIGGTAGLFGGMLMIWWMNAYDYPLVVGGKPMFSPFYAFPVAYEMTILLAAFGAIIGMFVMNRLPMHYHPVMKHPSVARASSDQFFIVIEAGDAHFDEEKTAALLKEIGGDDVTKLED
ncbi:MAG: DUF3341 domain-containing protein [Opitutales bacterium]